MMGGRNITAKLTRETMEGSVANGCPQKGTLPIAVKPGWRKKTYRGTQWAWLLYTGVCANLM